MKQMIIHLDEVVDFITRNNLFFVEGLIKLTSHEIDYKEANMIRSMIKVGAFPNHKELREFDFSFQLTINQQQILGFETLTEESFIHLVFLLLFRKFLQEHLPILLILCHTLHIFYSSKSKQFLNQLRKQIFSLLDSLLDSSVLNSI